MTSPRALALRGIAADVLTPTELLAAHAGRRAPEVDRSRGGVLTTFSGSYRVHGVVVELDGWAGLTETVALVELLELAAAAGTDAAAARLAAALADRDRATKDAGRYIARHGDGGYCLTPEQMRTPAWQVLRARLGAVGAAAAAWWDPAATPAGPAGEQLDLFAEAAS